MGGKFHTRIKFGVHLKFEESELALSESCSLPKSREEKRGFALDCEPESGYSCNMLNTEGRMLIGKYLL